MSDITVDFAQYTTDTELNGPYGSSDNVTLADDSSILDALSDSDIDGLATNNVDVISATDGVLSWTADQFSHLILGPVTIDPDTFAIMADTGADIAELSATQIGEIAAEGVAVINPTDSVLNFTVAQFEALGAMSVDASADFTLADTGANLAGMSAGEIASLGSLGVDHLDATDNVLALSVAQYTSLGTVTLTGSDDVTLADTGANLETLTSTDFGNLGSNGIDHIDATDNMLTISLADFDALGSVTLTPSDTVTLADTGATISGFTTAEIDTLATGGIDVFDATDNAISFTVAQYSETVTDNISLTAANTVTLADSGANLAALSAPAISELVNVDIIDATDNALTLSVDQFNAIEGNSIALTAGNTVTLSDTAANLATLDFSTLAADNVDQLDATTAYTNLTVSDLTALGTVVFTGASAVTLTDTGADIAAVSDFSVFAAHGIDTLDASDDTLTISEAQFQALGTTTLTGSDTVTISDTAANIVNGPNYSTLAAAGIDFLDATTAINVTVNDITNLGTVVFTSASAVTLADTGAHIAAVANFTTFGTHGVDTIDASNNTLTINATQFGELGAVTLTAADTVTISDTAANLGGLTFSGLAAANVDFLNSTNAYTTLTVQNVSDLGATHFTAASNVTLTDSAADIQAVSDFTTFATHGVDTIKSSDNALSLTVAQYSGLGTTHLTTADTVTLADTASDLNTYFGTFGSASALGTALSANGIDSIHAADGSLSVTGQGALGVFDGNATFLSTDTVTLADTGATIAVALSTILNHSGHLATLGIDVIDATDNVLNLTTAEYLDIAGNVALTAADTVTISDTAANIEALNTTEIGGLATNLIDAVSVTSGGDLDWSVAQWQAVPGGVSLSDAGFALVVDDSESNIEALSGAQLGALATSGAQELASTGGSLNFTVAQAEGFLGTGLAIASGDTGTLVDTGADIAAMTAAQFGQLAAAGFDTIDASDGSLTLSTAQISGLGATLVANANDLTITDTASNIDTFLDGASASTEIYDNGVNTIHATGGTLSIDVNEANNVAGTGAVFLSGDTVTLADTGAHIASMNFSSLVGLNVDSIDATDNTLSISLSQYDDIAGVVALTAGDDVTVTGNVDDLSTTDIAAFATNHVDHVLDSDGFNEVIWNVAQWNALTTAVTIDNTNHISFLNVVFDSGANLSAVTTTQIANFVTEGAEVFEGQPPGEESVSWNVAQLQAMGAAVWASTTVTIYDTGANLQAVSDFTLFSSHGIASISATDGSLTLTAAQFGGLGSVTVDSNDTFTLADTAANIEAMGTDGYTAMASAGVDFIHATDGSLTVTYDEFSAIASSSTVFTSADHVTLTGTQAQLFDSHAPDFFSSLGTQFHVDEISLTGDGVGHLDVDQWNALVTGGTTLDSANDITLSDTGADLGSETAANVAAMAGQIDHWESNDGNTVVASKAVLDALATASIGFTPNNYVVLFSDAETTVEGLTAAQLEGYITEGVTAFRASDTLTLNLDVSQVSAVLDNGAYFVPANTTTLVDTAANIEALTATQFGELVTGFVDAVTATGGTLDISVAQFQAVETALHSGALTLTNSAELADFGTLISALTVTEVGQLAGDNIGSIAAHGDLDFTQAKIGALGGVTVSTTGNFVLADSEANIEALSTATIDNDASVGVIVIHSTDLSEVLNFTAAQAEHLLSDGITVDNTAVTVTDTGANISGLSFSQLDAMANQGFTDIIDTSGDITWNFSQLDHLTTAIALNGNGLILSDSEATLEAQNATNWAYIASLATSITASDTSTLNLSYSQISQLFGSGATFATGDTVTLTDSSTNLDALTVAQIGDLSAVNVDAINATDDVLTWSIAQFGALNGVTLTAGDTVTLADTGAHLETLNFATLAAAGIDVLDATDNVLTLSVANFNALGAVALTAGDTVTISDTAADITTLDFSTLAGKNIDVLDVTDGFSLSVARYESMGAVKFAAADTITLSDTGSDIAALTSGQIGALAANGIDTIDATDNTLTLTVAQFNALGAVALTAGDTVTLADTGANLATLNFATLAAKGVDVLDATNNVLSLTVAQYQALGAVALTQADTVTLADTGANIDALTDTQFAALAGAGIDKIDASNNVLSLTVAQFNALGTVTLTGADTVTLLDTGANLETLNFSTLASKGIDILDASDNVLTLTAAQFQSLGTVALKSSDTVTLLDTGADISALTVGQFNALAAKGIDILDATDNAYSLNVAKVEGISPALSLAANDTITLQDSEANIEGMSGAQIAAAVARGIDIFHADSTRLNLSAAQVAAILGTGAVFLGSDTVTLTDTGANIEAFTAAQIGELAGAGVDKIDATDNAVTLNIAQYEALGSVQLSAGDTNTLADAYIPGLVDLSTTTIAGLGAAHINHIHGTFMFEWSVAQFSSLATNITIDTAYGVVRLYDTGAAIQSLTPTQIATFHTEGLAQLEIATHGGGSELDFSVAQTNAITTAALSFSTDNGSTAAPTIVDTGAAIAAMTTTQLTAAAADGFTGINASDDTLTLSIAQFNALGAIALTAADTVTVTDTESNIEALTNSQLHTLVNNNVDIIHSTNGILNVSVAQVGALLGTSTHFATGDTVTLVDQGATISALGAVQFGVLAAAGIDSIDASDNTLTLSLAQYDALGTVTLTQADTVTIQNDNTGISGMSVAEIKGLAASGVDVLESTSGNFSFSAAQTHALVNQTGGGHVALTAGDTFYVNDTAANVGGLSLSDIAAIGVLGAGSVDLIASGTLTINVAYYNAVLSAGVTIDGGDNVVLADTNANLRGLSVAQLGALAANGIDSIHATNGALSMSAAQLNALGSVALTQADSVTLSDSAVHIQALTAGQITGFATQGVDLIHTNTTALSMNESQVAAVLASSLAFVAGDTVTLADTGANIALLTSDQIAALAGKGVDAIDSTNDTLTLTLAQYNALGTVTLTLADTVTLADTAANLDALTTTQLSALGAGGIDVIHSTSNALSFTVAQANALDSQTSGTVNIAATDTLTIADTGAAIGAMTTGQLDAIAARDPGHVVLDASDNVLSLSVAQLSEIVTDSIGLTAADTVTLTDTGAALASYLTSGVIAALSNIDSIDATDNAISLSTAQLNALATASVALTQADTVSLVDTAADIESFTPTQLANYITQGVDIFQPSDTDIFLSVTQAQAVAGTGAYFATQESVNILEDTAADFATLTATQWGELYGAGINFFAVTTTGFVMSIADYQAMYGTGLTVFGGDAVTLSDTGADLATLTAVQIGGLYSTAGITHIDATDNALSLTEAQAATLAGLSSNVTLDATDTLTVADTGADIAALSASQLTALAGMGAGHVVLDASDNVLTITTAQYNAVINGGIQLTAADTVTLADSGANLASLNSTQLAALSANNVDAIHATDGAVTFSIAQLNALQTASIALTPADTVTLSDSEANIEALSGTQLAAYATQGVDLFSASDSTLNVTKAQVASVVGSSASFASGNAVTLADTGANIAALSSAQFGLLAAHGVDVINATDDVLSLTAAQYSNLGATTLTQADTVTLGDTGGHIAALTAAQFAQFAANGIDTIDASNNSLSLSVAQYEALGAVTLTQTDTVVLSDIGATLDALTAGQIGALAAAGIDRIDASDNVLSLNLAQFNALGTVVLTANDTVTLADTGANLEALTPTQITALGSENVDQIDATDGVLALSVAQYSALHKVSLDQTDNVTISDTGANIATLSASKIGALAAAGVDTLDATDNAITFSLAQYAALGSVHLSTTDVITVNGTGNTDLIQGGAENDILLGKGGDDVLFGGGGNDTLDGGPGNDTLNGGSGNDTVTYSDATSGVTVNLAAGTATGGAGNDLLTSIENATGSNYNDTLTGDANNNTLMGGAGNDTLIGGGGKDTLYGGAGADHFVYAAASDSNYTTGVDAIMDFSHADGDQIDISAMGAFSLVTHFTDHADQILIVTTGTNTYQVRGDINGDGVVDFAITVHSTTALVAGDFIL